MLTESWACIFSWVLGHLGVLPPLSISNWMLSVRSSPWASRLFLFVCGTTRTVFLRSQTVLSLTLCLTLTSQHLTQDRHLWTHKLPS